MASAYSIGKPVTAYFLSDPEKTELPIDYDANDRVTKIELSAEAPDWRNSVIAVEYAGPITKDSNAKGKYHWYTNRRSRHTEIRSSKNAGKQKLLNAVKEARD